MIILGEVGLDVDSISKIPGIFSRQMSFQLCFDYDQEVPTLQRLIALSAKTQWSLQDVDWEQRVGVSAYERILDWQGATRSEYVQGLPKKKKEELARQFTAFDLSQILHGEQGAMLLAAQLTGDVDDMDARIFAATQAKDEARHVMAVKELVGRIGPVYPCGPVIEKMITGLLDSSLWPKKVIGLQLFLEARALLSFRQFLLFIRDPVFRDAIMKIERDESQHVAFGIQYLKSTIESLDKEDRETLIDYALFLDENVWNMTHYDEYRAVFEEIDLDYDYFRETFQAKSFLAGGVSPRTQKTIDEMHTTFEKWFIGAVSRIGLEEVLERREKAGVLVDVEEGESIEESLPWVQD